MSSLLPPERKDNGYGTDQKCGFRVDAPAPLATSTSPWHEDHGPKARAKPNNQAKQTQQTNQNHPSLRHHPSEEHELLKLLDFLSVPSNSRNKTHENLQVLNLQDWVPIYYPSILFNWFSFPLI